MRGSAGSPHISHCCHPLVNNIIDVTAQKVTRNMSSWGILSEDAWNAVLDHGWSLVHWTESWSEQSRNTKNAKIIQIIIFMMTGAKTNDAIISIIVVKIITKKWMSAVLGQPTWFPFSADFSSMKNPHTGPLYIVYHIVQWPHAVWHYQCHNCHSSFVLMASFPKDLSSPHKKIHIISQMITAPGARVLDNGIDMSIAFNSELR